MNIPKAKMMIIPIGIPITVRIASNETNGNNRINKIPRPKETKKRSLITVIVFKASFLLSETRITPLTIRVKNIRGIIIAFPGIMAIKKTMKLIRQLSDKNIIGRKLI